MNIAELSMGDLAGLILGFFLTLLVFSYIFGDNALFRLTIHLFIGVASGYAAMVAIYNILLPRLIVPLLSEDGGERLLALAPLLLGLLLFTKLSPRLARFGNLPMAFLVGAGAAAALAGALLGTLFPQTSASINLWDLQAARESGTGAGVQFINGSLILAGTLTTLVYFHFGVRPRPERPDERAPWIVETSRAGEFFIAVTFGVLFAGVYAAALAALVERLSFMLDFVRIMIMAFTTS